MISGVVSWITSVCGWSVMRSVWCVMVGSMAVIFMCWVLVWWATPGVAAVIPMSWPAAASVWIMTTQVVVSVKMRFWSGMTLPVPVFMVVPWTWFGMVASVRSGLVMFCWGSQRRNPVWAIHDNVTILFTLKASNVRVISCYMSLLLAPETEILFIGHHVDCRRWNNHGCDLLYSSKLLNFRDYISECLWSFS